MKRLLICRHAKSSWSNRTLADKDRPLNKRGKHDAPMMGRRLHAQGIRADAVITSPAKRARKTARGIAREIAFPVDRIRVEEVLYGGSSSHLVEMLRMLENSVETVLIFGHNPDFTMLANLLGGLTIDNVPTCGIVALDFGFSAWKELAPGTGTLAFYDFPKNVTNTIDRGST